MLKNQEIDLFFEEYRRYLSQLAPITDEEWLFYRGHIDVLEVKKGHFFTKIGEHGAQFGFVAQGLFKQFFYTKSGKIFINGFIDKNRMLSDFPALIRDESAKTNIVALEDGVVLVSRRKKDRAYGFQPHLGEGWSRLS